MLNGKNIDRSMHLIVLEHEPSSVRGGQELNLFEVCKGLSQRGHEISLIYEKEGNLIEHYEYFCDSLIKVSSYGYERRRIADVLKFLPNITTIGKVPVRKNSVVFSNSYYSVFWGYIFSSLKKTPFVCYFQIPPLSFNFLFERRIGLKGVKQFIAVSNQTRLDWVKLGINPDKISVVYNGTDIEKNKPTYSFSTIRKEWNIPENTRVVSYVGRLDRMKGIETLIKAFALVLKSGITAMLLIAGKPIAHVGKNGVECPEEGEKYKQFLKQLSIDLGIDQYVEFLGHVTNTTSVYQVSDVTVLPSQWSEPFGRTIIESMACGTPVVASRIGGIPEILTGEFQNGLFEPGNERDLSDTLNLIINWRDRSPQLGDRCREHILDKFSLDKTIDGIEKVLLTVLQ